ncbi:TPA: type II toxin-antitoxin system Phd/YefM family antitoxin [Enterobacter hormaechei subsp. steigerwaltii]|nr:type II toxin-antitoxin system Phd/YefM family antitoxin [Enterobacter hormaechei subsp. steigerwaltii]
MQTVTSAELRNTLAAVMDEAEPVLITRRGAESKVLISEAEYRALKEAKFNAEFDFLLNRHAHTFAALADR